MKDLIVGGEADASLEPSGPVHLVDTATVTSTAGSNSTAQVKVGEEPDRMGLVVSETTVTIGWGTGVVLERSCTYKWTSYSGHLLTPHLPLYSLTLYNRLGGDKEVWLDGLSRMDSNI